MGRVLLIVMIFTFLMPYSEINAQRSKKKNSQTNSSVTSPLDDLNISALKFRSVGPSKTSGRISDLAIDPDNPSTYYVAVSSGGVWKTVNAGTTFTPIFDSQASYSTGCVTLDPNDKNVVWVGSGENNNQRSVAYGDGIYKSIDGGSTWKNMGLKTSEHISKIIVHPDNSDVVWVAAVGPLWNSGGDRGVYMTTDGGSTWKAVLTIDKYTGIADMIIDPSNPDILYAAAHQRARHVFTYIGGGPGSSIYKSVDGGKTWNETNNGLPGGDLGRIGLSVSPADPNKVYAIVEAQDDKSGVYRTVDGGATWEKRGGHVTSGNYYQEIISDPVNPDVIYSMDTWMSMSTDGGKSFNRVKELTKHVDSHCIWVDPNNTQHWLVGCDGGIYETWDASATWDYKANLPITQFYKVSVDNDEPFYNIYGGTQDNNSMGGPSRTSTAHGIVNSDWYITHGGDGFETQVDPENPDIVYSQSQYGVLVRYDRKSGEEVGIQPKERKAEDSYRWNWDAPLQASSHVSGRIYFAANKVFRSDDYGNSWEVLSDDLTQQINRNELRIMDKVWGIETIAKNRSTSPYGTLVALSESTLDKDLIVVGSDDGLIHVTTDGGSNWKKISSISGVPNNSYINAVYCSKHDENVIFAAINHHKYGDFKPYLVKSINKGQTWQLISGNLPDRGSVYAIEQDHVDPDLLFCGTEFGVFFSPNGGQRWRQLKAGVPTIAVRDLAIQERENDLVLGTFGRGFYVLDDYSLLREVGNGQMADEAQIFAARPTLQYEQSNPMGLSGKSFQGDSFYSGDDLEPVALIDYYYPTKEESLEAKRKSESKNKTGKDDPYPTYEELQEEKDEYSPELLFTITDANGEVVRKLAAPAKQGIHRLQWDLRYASKRPISINRPKHFNPYAGRDEGILVSPGNYTVTMEKVIGSEFEAISEPMTFEVKRIDNAVMPVTDTAAKLKFQQDVTELSRKIQGAGKMISEIDNKLKYIKVAIEKVETPNNGLYADYDNIKKDMKKVRNALYGDNLKSLLDIDQPPSPASRIGWIQYEQGNSTSDPTETHRMSYSIAEEEFGPILDVLVKVAKEDLDALEQKLEDADAPYTPGRAIKMID